MTDGGLGRGSRGGMGVKGLNHVLSWLVDGGRGGRAQTD